MRRTGIVALIAAVAVIVGTLVVGSGGESNRESDEAPPAAEPDASFVPGRRAIPYRVTYEVTGPDGQQETDRVWVRPPFESRVETSAGTPPGGDASTVRVLTMERLRLGGPTDPVVVARVPGPAAPAIRLAPILDAAVGAGLLEVGEQRVVADRRCQVFRSAAPLTAGPLMPMTADGHVDTCVDEDGLVLAEIVTEGNAMVHSRRAVEVEIDPSMADGLFDTGPLSAPVDQGGGNVTAADPTSAPVGPFFELPETVVPAGFERIGRYSVIPPQPENFSDPERNDRIIAGVTDVYVTDGDSAELVVVWQGGTLGQVTAFAPVEHGLPVSSAVLGDGELLLSAVGSEVRFALPGGRFLHIIGTLDPDRLVELADGFTETEGSGLVLLED